MPKSKLLLPTGFEELHRRGQLRVAHRTTEGAPRELADDSPRAGGLFRRAGWRADEYRAPARRIADARDLGRAHDLHGHRHWEGPSLCGVQWLEGFIAHGMRTRNERDADAMRAGRNVQVDVAEAILHFLVGRGLALVQRLEVFFAAKLLLEYRGDHPAVITRRWRLSRPVM